MTGFEFITWCFRSTESGATTIIVLIIILAALTEMIRAGRKKD